VRQVLAPELRRGDIVVMDNLSSHKRPAVREVIEAAGQRCSSCPPNAPITSDHAAMNRIDRNPL